MLYIYFTMLQLSIPEKYFDYPTTAMLKNNQLLTPSQKQEIKQCLQLLNKSWLTIKQQQEVAREMALFRTLRKKWEYEKYEKPFKRTRTP